MVQVIWTPRAKEDLKDIADYISNDSPRYALEQILKITGRVEMLYQMPYSGRMIPEIKNEKIRELIEGNYRIVYRIFAEDQIDIITVVHGARLLKL